jgi:hypothetical protein
MSWLIRQACPQCGAPVDMKDTERFLSCPYCRVRLFISPSGMSRYVIPPRGAMDGEILYVPYWRLKGTRFTIGPTAVGHRIVDATARALGIDTLPFSLGLRPQTLRLSFARPSGGVSFFRPAISVSSAVEAITGRIGRLAGEGQRAPLRKYVGEQRSIIYAPVRIEGGRVHDAVLDRPVPNLPPDLLHDLKREDTARWGVDFLPAVCRDCGWDLAAEPGGLVFRCMGCGSFWHFGAAHPSSVIVESDAGDGEQLPFWRVRVEGRGHAFGTYADLVRWANLPKVPLASWEAESAWFMIPAFKIRPDLFLRLAGQMTVSRLGHTLRTGAGGMRLPVTLSLDEACKSVRVIHAELASSKSKVLPTIATMGFAVLESRLAYVSFARQGAELVHDDLGVSVSAQALDHGQSL